MKLLTAVFASAALIAAPMTIASPASAQAVTTTTTTTTAHTYHAYGYGYAHHRHAAYRAPCGHGYGACDSVYLSGVSPVTGQAVDMDYQAPIGEPIYANGDVVVDCACTHRR